MGHNDDTRKAAWDRHNLEQLLYFRSLSLRHKLQAVEGMCDIARRFQQMRAQGLFHVAGQEAEIQESGAENNREK